MSNAPNIKKRSPKTVLLDWQGLADHLGIGREAAQAILRLIGRKVGRRIVTTPEAVEAWLAHREPIER